MNIKEKLSIEVKKIKYKFCTMFWKYKFIHSWGFGFNLRVHFAAAPIQKDI